MKTKLTAFVSAIITVLFVESEQITAQQITPVPNMVWINPGTFLMGSPETEAGHRPYEEPQTQVTISRGFYMGMYEVTAETYLSVMRTNRVMWSGTNSANYLDNKNRPVVFVSWFDATNYCHELTKQERSTGHIGTDWKYRLPTEAEWEYSCRAGTTTSFHYGTALRSGWETFDGTLEYDSEIGTIYNPNGTWFTNTTEVGSYMPNTWGLYDMHGNVDEWCLDYLGTTLPGGQAADLVGQESDEHIKRGGYYHSPAYWCRSAFRTDWNVSRGIAFGSATGFRIVLAPTTSNPAIETIATGALHPPYGNYEGRQPGKNNLVLITHGWIRVDQTPEESTAWVDTMALSISEYLVSQGLNDWQVVPYKWVEGAHLLLPGDIHGLAERVGIQNVLSNAKMDGGNLGLIISSEEWDHVHLIAHSAGSGLIQATSEKIQATSPNTTIHCTFLDAFVGLSGEERSNYGKGSQWADSYFSHDFETSVEILTSTEGPLDYAYNVDVTRLDPNKEELTLYYASPLFDVQPCYQTKSSHHWPIDFYYTTTVISWPLAEGFGFPLGKEGGEWNFTLANYGESNEVHKKLGPEDLDCFVHRDSLEYTPPTLLDFTKWPTVEGGDGTVEAHPYWFELIPGSPVWLATIVNLTNAVNLLSFEAVFPGTSGLQGQLSVYWDTNVIGFVDQSVVGPGMRSYTLAFPQANPGNSHILGFRFDPFTGTPSSVVVSNINLRLVGPSEPFRLSVTGHTSNGLNVFELTGQPGFNYLLQSSTNLIDWKISAILVNTNGTVPFVDTQESQQTRRFFRATVSH